MDKYGERFSLEELRAHLEVEMKQSRSSDQDAIRGISMLARSNYEVSVFNPQQPLSERILFPATPSQRNGIEDARFVRFLNDDGTYVYYATFTAFRRQGDLSRTSGDLRLPPLSVHHLERSGCQEQRYGSVPPEDQWTLCHALPPGQ